jgi:hypothetical protein
MTQGIEGWGGLTGDGGTVFGKPIFYRPIEAKTFGV